MVMTRAAVRLKFLISINLAIEKLISVNLTINRKVKPDNIYQLSSKAQFISLKSRNLGLILECNLIMLALRLLSLQAQPVIKAHKFVDISWRESSTGFADDKSRLGKNTALTLHLRLKINRN